MPLSQASMPVLSFPRALGEQRSFAPDGMTSRQVECLSWVQEGKSATDIGAILGISRRTVVQMKRQGGRFRITEVWYEPLRKRALAA